MFHDNRSKKVILVAHCVLNQNSISDGTADYPAMHECVVKLLMESNVGMIQLPCPELNCLGLDRGDIHGAEREVIVENSRIRNSLAQHIPMKIMHELANQTVYQIKEYLQHGFTILGIIGINRSPSCGVNTTSKNNQEAPGKGMFMETLNKALQNENIDIPLVGIKALESEAALDAIKLLL